MKSDNEFIESLKGSEEYVNMVAEWLRTHGCKVEVPSVQVRPSFEERHKYIDTGDIKITLRIEVKHRSFDFTSKQDYPYDTVMIDETFKIDRINRGELWGYVIVNQSATHLCFVMAHTRKNWKIISKHDSKDAGRLCNSYVCPVELCKFLKLSTGGMVNENRETKTT